MSVVTSRYARALADVIFERKLDAMQMVQEVRSLVELTRSTPDLRRIWETPAVPTDQKRGLLKALTDKLGLSQPVHNFMAVLIDHHRIPQLEEIARSFEHELNDRLGLAEVEIISARELNDGEKNDLEKRVSTMTGKRVRAKYATDVKLLGGAIVKLGSTIYDGSVRGQLQKIKEELSS